MVKQLASEYDIVLNMAISYNANAAEAFIHGLGERKQQYKEGIYIHVRVGSYRSPLRSTLTRQDLW